MAKHATIYSIAKDLGIHASTVSRAFTRPEVVRPELVERILARAQEVSYEPNPVARGLITGRTGALGLLIPDIANPFFPPVVRSVQKAAHGIDHTLLLMDSQLDPELELAMVAQVRGRVDGFVFVSPRSDVEVLVEHAKGRPVVLVNRSMDAVTSVLIDNARALRQAGEHLRDLGHHRIVLLTGPSASWAAKQRADAVRSWAAESDVELLEIGPTEALFDGGVAAAQGVVDSGASAVLAFDDLMACGVVAGLAQLGVEVPRDISVIGGDDVLLARVTTPSLTTIRAPFEELGPVVIDAMAGLLARTRLEAAAAASQDRPATQVVLGGELVLRGSTGPVRAG